MNEEADELNDVFDLMAPLKIVVQSFDPDSDGESQLDKVVKKYKQFIHIASDDEPFVLIMCKNPNEYKAAEKVMKKYVKENPETKDYITFDADPYMSLRN